MGEPAKKRMTLSEFLSWNPPGDTRYELFWGHLVAMAPGTRAHSGISANAIRHLGNSVRPGCSAHSEAGIVLPHRADTWYVADIAVTCSPHHVGELHVVDPVLIVEVLSPSTEANDRKIKLLDYRRIPSVQEIVLIDSQRMFCEVHRRDGDRWVSELLAAPDERLVLACGLDQPLAALYANVALPGSDEEQPPVA